MNDAAFSLPTRWRFDAENAGVFCGEWRGDGPLLSSHSPIDGRTLAAVRTASAADYEATLARAVVAFARWRTVPAPVRGETVRQLGLALREAKADLARLVTWEMGKILAESLGEVQEMIDICDFAVGLSRQLHGLTIASERPGHRLQEQWHPLGPVAVITAFNFPVAVWAWNAALACVCGDVTIWKPSEKTPLCALAVTQLAERVCRATGADPAIFSLLVGGPEIGQRLADDARIPLVSATGSCRMGRLVGESVHRRLGRTLLELGGNGAVIVAPSADLDLATRAIFFGAIGTAGQRCTSTRRVIAHRAVEPELERRLRAAYQSLRLGNPLEPKTLMGPLVDPQAVEIFQSAVVRAQKEGGEILAPGGPRPELGACYALPALVRMPAQTDLVREETFAPLLYLLTYDDFAEALAWHNDVPQGLSSAIFTNDYREAEEFISATGSDCGLANVNAGTSGAEIGGAFGGEKATGGGRESGSDAWKNYMRRQTNTLNFSRALPLAQGIKFPV
ncbi:MAG: aldehyde dehydrogenase family protein [Verrucomicrobia bacterium]|nr:aldehyde dehydrogenase family protein [Verrucomicrobiota bacterium]